jgi:tRNA pseudouridine synthase 10
MYCSYYRDTLDQLKQGEEEKTKTYEAICWCQRPLTPDDYDKMNNTRDLDLQQKTPIRVLHRRPVATRLRRIYNMNATEIDANHFRMILSTQAGTYPLLLSLSMSLTNKHRKWNQNENILKN